MTADRQSRWKWAALVGGAALAVYLWTSCRTVYVGDSGELTVALSTGGIAHPPGYPLYTILGYGWLRLLGFINPAFATNLFSAVAAAAAAVGVFFLFEKTHDSSSFPALSAGAALVYAFSFPVWSSATNAEVYALAGLLYVAALNAVVSFSRGGSNRRLLAAAFFCGLTITHHFSSGVVLFSLIVAVWIYRRRLSWGAIGKAVFFLLFPLSLYFYLPLRFNPALPVNWMNSASLTSLWHLISGKIYQSYASVPTPADLIFFLKKIGLQFLTAPGPGLALLAIPGIYAAVKKNTGLAIIILAPAVLNLLMLSAYHIPDFEGYMLPGIISVLFLMRSGVEWLAGRFRFSHVATTVTAFCLAIIPLGYHFDRCDLHRFTLARHYGADLLDSAPQNALLFLKSDNGSHTALYLHYLEGIRPDVELYSVNSTFTRLRYKHPGSDFTRIVDSLAATGRVWQGTEYIINQGMAPGCSQAMLAGLDFGPPINNGLPNRINERISRFVADTLPDINLNKDAKAQEISLDYRLWLLDRSLRAGSTDLTAEFSDLRHWGRQVTDPQTCLAVAQFFRAENLPDEALAWIDRAFAADPSRLTRRNIYVGLAGIYRQQGRMEKAADLLRKALDIDPGSIPARYNLNLVRADMAMRAQDWPAAAAAYEELLRADQTEPLLYYNLGVVYDRIPGGSGKALTSYRTFIQMSGKSHPETTALARSRIAKLEAGMSTP